MTQNLRLQNYNLTAKDSDVSMPFYLPPNNTSDFNKNDTAAVYNDSTYGTFYTWYGATAGSGNQQLQAGINASQSICPVGWQLPTEDIYTNLVKTYNYGDMRKSPMNFSTGQCTYPYGCGGEHGCFWASSHDFVGDGHWLYIMNGAGTPWKSNGNRYVCGIYNCGPCTNYGHSVRCVKK